MISDVNAAALAAYPALLERWMPGGRVENGEYVALNPVRVDGSPGSFKVNIRNGRWADFATDDRGRDPVSLAAYLRGVEQGEAARQLATELASSGRRRGDPTAPPPTGGSRSR